MSYWVYVHTCPNGKRYVGCTTRVKPERRWARGNGYQYNKHFYSAIQKYGWSSIKHEAWELTCKSEMYYAEKYLIAYYHTTESEFGYNNSSGGESGGLGCTKSEETRKKMSQVKKGKSYSEETKRRISEALKGKHHSEETRKHLSEVRKGRILSEEHKKHISEARKGKPRKPHSEEAKRRIAEAKKGKHQPRVKIRLQDGTLVETTKANLVKNYVNKGKKFEYVD